MSRKVEVDQREVGDLNLQCFSLFFFYYLSTSSLLLLGMYTISLR